MKAHTDKPARVSVERTEALGALAETFCREARLVSANYLLATRGLATDMHLHPHVMHFTCAVAGKGVCIVGDRRQEIVPGSVLVLYPKVHHRFVADRGDPYRVYMVKVQVPAPPVALPSIIRLGRRRRRMEGLLDRLQTAFHSPRSAVTDLRLMALLLDFLAMLIELSGDAQGETAAAHGPDPSHAFSSVLERLQQPPFVYPGIDALASAFHMSRRNFTRLFREATGTSPYRFYLDMRVLHAHRMLLLREYRVKEIAAQCGYANSQNLIRAYKTRFPKG